MSKEGYVEIYLEHSLEVFEIEPYADGSLSHDELLELMKLPVHALIYKYKTKNCRRLILPKRGLFSPPPDGWFNGTVTALVTVHLSSNSPLKRFCQSKGNEPMPAKMFITQSPSDRVVSPTTACGSSLVSASKAPSEETPASIAAAPENTTPKPAEVVPSNTATSPVDTEDCGLASQDVDKEPAITSKRFCQSEGNGPVPAKVFITQNFSEHVASPVTAAQSGISLVSAAQPPLTPTSVAEALKDPPSKSVDGIPLPPPSPVADHPSLAGIHDSDKAPTISSALPLELVLHPWLIAYSVSSFDALFRLPEFAYSKPSCFVSKTSFNAIREYIFTEFFNHVLEFKSRSWSVNTFCVFRKRMPSRKAIKFAIGKAPSSNLMDFFSLKKPVRMTCDLIRSLERLLELVVVGEDHNVTYRLQPVENNV